MAGKKDIHQYETLADLYQDLGIKIRQKAEFTIENVREVHQTIPYKSPIFRTNYYSFVFVKNGRGNYTTDDQTFEYTSRTIYFTNPGHLKGFEFYELEEAYLITLSESFLKTNVHSEIFREFPFLLAETVPPQTLSEKEFQVFERIYLHILEEYRGNSQYKFPVIGNLFVVLLLKIKEQFWSGYIPLEEGDRSSQIVKRFKQHLEKHYRDLAEGKISQHFQAQDYAHLQHLHPNYLNTVIKSKTGRSISNWIAEKTATEAKALLKNSSLSIKEIGIQLGFHETAHFSNFFKKQTSQSPSAFRKIFR
ncbi:MAG: AraC family transcriptional regulator [Bacteroidota bacterium]